jgi:hypothetical protein
MKEVNIFAMVRQCEELLPYLFDEYKRKPSGALFIQIRSCMNAMGLAETQFFEKKTDQETVRMMEMVLETLNHYKNSSEEK